MVVRPELQERRGAETVPVSEVAMNPTWASKGKEYEPNDFATFVTMPSVGKSHTIQLEPRQERDLQIPGERGARQVTVQGSGKRIRFVEGAFTTPDPEIIDILLTDPKCRFGTEIDINRRDPTGYWRKSGKFDFVTDTRIIMTDQNIGQGALNRQAAKVA